MLCSLGVFTLMSCMFVVNDIVRTYVRSLSVKNMVNVVTTVLTILLGHLGLNGVDGDILGGEQ